MDRSEIIANLAKKSLSDPERLHLEKFYALTEVCPTCSDSGIYRLDGKTYECDCEVQKLLHKHYLAANIPKKYHTICVDEHFVGGDRGLVVEIVNEYLNNFENNRHFGLGKNFAGAFGSGKTFAMTHILKSLVKQGKAVYFITFDELINIWGASWSDDNAKKLLTDRLLSAEVLGLDELRTDPRNANGFLQNGLDNVVRHRTSNTLPTLITTNMLPSEEEREFPKVFSLLSEVNDRVYLLGKDLRGGIVARTNKELADRGERRPIC